MIKSIRTLAAWVALAGAALAPPSSHAANAFLTDLSSISYTGMAGVLRSGSIWAPAPPQAAVATVVDGSFLPTNTQ